MNKKERAQFIECLGEMAEAHFRILRAVHDLKSEMDPAGRRAGGRWRSAWRN